MNILSLIYFMYFYLSPHWPSRSSKFQLCILKGRSSKPTTTVLLIVFSQCMFLIKAFLCENILKLNKLSINRNVFYFIFFNNRPTRNFEPQLARYSPIHEPPVFMRYSNILKNVYKILFICIIMLSFSSTIINTSPIKRENHKLLVIMWQDAEVGIILIASSSKTDLFCVTLKSLHIKTF